MTNRKLLAALCAAFLSAGISSGAAAADITVAVASGFTTLDPYDASDTLSRSVAQSFYEGLFRYDANMKIVPELAEGYEVSPDGRVYTVKLKAGVKFQDGTDFNAEAVRLNFERVLNPDKHLTRRGFFSMIEKIEAVDPLTVRFTLKNPFSAFLGRLSNGTAVMMCPSILDKPGSEIALKPCGTGPYLLKDYNPSERLEVVKNPQYRTAGLPKLDRIVWRPVVENATRAAMIRTGEAQFAHTMPAEQLKTLKDDPNVRIIATPSGIVRYILMNQTKKPWTDVRVRQAVNYAINREALVKVAFGGYAQPMSGVIPETMASFEKLGPWPYDPKKARELLKEAGYPNGFETELWSGYNNTTSAKVIQFVQQQLRQVGIRAKLRTLEAGQRVSLVESVKTPAESKTNLYYIGWSNSTSEPDWALRPLFESRNAPPVLANEGYYANPKVDDLLEKALSETDEARRLDLYREVQRELWKDAAFVPLVTETNTAAASVKLKNFTVRADGGYEFRDAELVD